MGALPPDPRILSLAADPEGKQKDGRGWGRARRFRVQPLERRLGSVPTVALSFRPGAISITRHRIHRSQTRTAKEPKPDRSFCPSCGAAGVTFTDSYASTRNAVFSIEGPRQPNNSANLRSQPIRCSSITREPSQVKGWVTRDTLPQPAPSWQKRSTPELLRTKNPDRIASSNFFAPRKKQRSTQYGDRAPSKSQNHPLDSARKGISLLRSPKPSATNATNCNGSQIPRPTPAAEP